MFKLAKSSAITSRTQAINQLKAVLVSADPILREQLSGLSIFLLVRACATLQVIDPTGDSAQAARHMLQPLAERISHLTKQIDDLDTQRLPLSSHAPDLLTRNGVGPDTGATLIIAAGDNSDRLHSEAAFAALHRVTLLRLRCDPTTRAYVERRVREGKRHREAIRCLKRYTTPELYPLLRTPPRPAQDSTHTAAGHPQRHQARRNCRAGSVLAAVVMFRLRPSP